MVINLTEIEDACTLLKLQGVAASVVIQAKDYQELNSYELGETGNRFTIKYRDLDDLKAQLNDAAEGRKLAAELGLLPAPKEPKEPKPPKAPKETKEAPANASKP